MSEIYPKISETEGKPDTFRLQKINEINTYFEKEIEHYREVLRKYKRADSAISKLNITFNIGLAALGCGPLALVSFAILPPVALSIEGVTIVIAIASSVLFDRLHDRFMNKIKKHTEIYTCAVAKLNTIHDIFSKALEDGKIDTDEFKLLLTEKDKYIELKNNIRKKSLDSKQKLNIEEIQKEFLEKGKQLGKNEIMEKLKGSV
jgi:ABC-type multidrug transport system fused ATPase/permease subunit